MFIIRPVQLSDLPQLVELSSLTGFGLTTLPRDAKLLEKRIRQSQRSFEMLVGEPSPFENFLFVMQQIETRRVVGTSGITAKVGGYDPFYAYRMETSVHRSDTLNVHKNIQVLHLVAEHNGPCEIGSLFLHPDFRRGGNGRLLSLARFVFMAEHPEHFDPTVIAEMRGVIDATGHSPFWDALGKHFFDIDFLTADYLSVVNKKFIADLMPRHPIYIPLLPPQAQAVIAQVHPDTRPGLHVLEEEGFRLSGMVDIFEAGPIVICPRDQIRTVRESVHLKIGEVADQPVAGSEYIVMKSDGQICASKGQAQLLASGSVRIDRTLAQALQLNVGDAVRIAPLRPAATQSARTVEAA
jgi:arginine N-succinyltransferase